MSVCGTVFVWVAPISNDRELNACWFILSFDGVGQLPCDVIKARTQMMDNLPSPNTDREWDFHFLCRFLDVLPGIVLSFSDDGFPVFDIDFATWEGLKELGYIGGQVQDVLVGYC